MVRAEQIEMSHIRQDLHILNVNMQNQTQFARVTSRWRGNDVPVDLSHRQEVK